MKQNTFLRRGDKRAFLLSDLFPRNSSDSVWCNDELILIKGNIKHDLFECYSVTNDILALLWRLYTIKMFMMKCVCDSEKE